MTKPKQTHIIKHSIIIRGAFMISDERQKKLANVLVDFSIGCKEGDKVWIDGIGCDYQLIGHIIREVYAHGGMPFVNILDNKITREIVKGASDEMLKTWAKRDGDFMSQCQCYIGIRGGDNSYELSDIPADRMQAYGKYYTKEVHHNIRVCKTRWVVLRYPTQGMAQLASMSTEAFEDYYFNVCTLDYRKMANAMNPLVKLMEKTDKVRIVAKDTDLSFSIKGIPAVKCSGYRNIPDGEVYTAPVRDSVNGVIHYNIPTVFGGNKYEDIRLVFKNGKIIEATSNNTEQMNKVFDTDEGSRYVGEFSFGVNPYITKGIGDILFDEKISGSIHFTPGSCYEEAWNGNESAIHWDLVLCQRPEYGGGEIWMDDVLVRKDGRFVLPELDCLNPENLM